MVHLRVTNVIDIVKHNSLLAVVYQYKSIMKNLHNLIQCSTLTGCRNQITTCQAQQTPADYAQYLQRSNCRQECISHKPYILFILRYFIQQSKHILYFNQMIDYSAKTQTFSVRKVNTSDAESSNTRHAHFSSKPPATQYVL